ncbi:butyrophilin subfamily 3 member A2-like [Eucyclogobius newberryi]|uniref:butyrophilin subfamily 3 member A2-like n=1 Tax=Eucyclogobius newberryi TaxID=166745 RepID=UPI003B5B60A6
MIAPSQPIIASVGSDVTLPCELDPVKDLRDLVVEWARQDLTPRYIHILRDGLALMLDQNSLYLGRTALSESRLQKGDMSLSLTRVKSSDGGTYQCFIPQMNTRAEVTLLVVSVAPVSLSLTKERSGSPVLRCESRGWYPEPELEWLDSEGTVLLRTEAQRGASDELFSVSSRLSVEQRLGNTLTCRVKQQESGQSREAQLRLTDEFLEACSSCAVAWLLFALGLCLVAAAAVSFVVWKFKINRNKSEIINIELGEKEEREIMIKNDETTNVLKFEEVTQRFDLKEFVPEQKENLENDLFYVNDVIHKLTETKVFLTKLKDKPQEAIHNMNRLIEAEKNRQISAMNNVLSMGKQGEKKKQNLEALEKEKKQYEKTIEDLDKQMKTLEEVILVTVQRKGAMEGELKHMTKLMEKEKKHLETEPQQKRKEEEGNENVQDKVQDQPEGAQSGTSEHGTNWSQQRTR